MTPFEKQLEDLKSLHDADQATVEGLANGGKLIRVPNFLLPEGWLVPNSPERRVTIVFFAPPGYPGSQPDCFWVDPVGIRLANGGTPQNTNDSNPIPGYNKPPPHGTWFSWHVQGWNPNTDSLVTYFKVIRNRLFPAR